MFLIFLHLHINTSLSSRKTCSDLVFTSSPQGSVQNAVMWGKAAFGWGPAHLFPLQMPFWSVRDHVHTNIHLCPQPPESHSLNSGSSRGRVSPGKGRSESRTRNELFGQEISGVWFWGTRERLDVLHHGVGSVLERPAWSFQIREYRSEVIPTWD